MSNKSSNGLNGTVSNSIGDIKIGKEDLQLLLRSQIGPQCIVVRSSVTGLLPPGENFACLLYRVLAVVKEHEKSEEEEMDCVAKVYPVEPEILKVFDFSSLFRKEIFFYEKFAPQLKKLEIDFGVEEREAFDIVPKLYGVRRSWNGEDDEKVDSGAMILMQNLNSEGYYMLNKLEGDIFNTS